MKINRIPIPAIPFAPPVYLCPRAAKPFTLDGRLDKEFWADAPFTDLFLDIEGAHMPKPRFSTRAKMLWDDENLYVGAVLEGDEIWANVTGRDEIIFQDNDFELFIDPDSDTQQYYEFEMNARNTVWDLLLTKAYRDNGRAVNGYDIHGLRTAVWIDGELNQPNAKNRRWSVEIVIPFASIVECSETKANPKAGEYFRMNFSRVQWTIDRKDGAYAKRTNPATGAPLPEDNWVWAPTGVVNIHYPEQWGFVFFTDNDSDPAHYPIPEDEGRKWELRKLYYAEQLYFDEHQSFTDDLSVLTGILEASSPCEENKRVDLSEVRVETTAHSFELSCPCADGTGTLVLFSDGKVLRI